MDRHDRDTTHTVLVQLSVLLGDGRLYAALKHLPRLTRFALEHSGTCLTQA